MLYKIMLPNGEMSMGVKNADLILGIDTYDEEVQRKLHTVLGEDIALDLITIDEFLKLWELFSNDNDGAS
jgi:hypothetical protein